MAKSKSKGKGKLTSALDTELFAVDVAGDEGMRRSMLSSTWDSPAAAHPRKGSGKPLRSQEILAQRSKVPAQVSKATPGIMAAQKLERERRAKITPEMKRRLRGMVKRDHTVDRGLWDVAQEKQLHFLGGDVAVQAGGYDVWDTPSTSKQVAALEAVPEDIRDVVVKRTVKPPTSLREHSLLSNTSAIPRAVHAPHPGESYNPTMTDHQALLAAEHLKAVGEEETAARYTEQKEKVMRGQDGLEDPYATGYANEVGSGEEDSEAEAEAEGTEEGAQARKQRRRKTERAHRKKQANRLLEAQTRQKVRLSKAQRHAISSLSHIVGDIKASDTISLATLHKRKTQLAAKLAETGLAEFRSGPARVPKPKQHFLLSEELPESLRQLKTDGNLWSEWLDSSRRRGKVQMERRSFARMKKVRGRGLKDVEKATWRMFQV